MFGTESTWSRGHELLNKLQLVCLLKQVTFFTVTVTEKFLLIFIFSYIQKICLPGYSKVVCISIIPHIQFTNHFTLIHWYICISPLSSSNWPWIKSVQWCLCNLFVWFQYFQFVCLTMNVVWAWPKAMLKC